MQVTVECSRCGTANRVDACDAVRAVIEAADRDSIFAGFLCTECGEAEETKFCEE
ncbi:MAG: hypothetical protein KGZ56_01685 [Dethiobacter sp.]|jgi:hypothetical protein|nr:hypothetical protein [Dethiobacter sp.]MBS3897872.1 hypothetical protein [Dethiobacter sp.]